MKNVAHNPIEAASTRSFNYNKLQAAACIAGSAAVSIGGIYWLVQQFF